jgi:hypothetical protein
MRLDGHDRNAACTMAYKTLMADPIGRLRLMNRRGQPLAPWRHAERRVNAPVREARFVDCSVEARRLNLMAPF